jgi:hypothetical protein
MQGRSIRSIALDYYRKRGAEIRPLDGAEVYEIVQPEGPALKVTFTDEAVTGDQVMPLTSTSPQWRAILEDLTAEVAVSYRYLTAGPIPNAAATLEAAAPAGWRVTAAKLLGVDHRPAIGVTHRATFDSPALNACQELIFQHLWDVERAERLPAMETGFYQTPAIVLRPETTPGPEMVQALIDRSAGIVDTEADAHGAKLDKELAGLLAETEKRVNQYYDQQMGNVLAREVQLTEKLDATIKKLSEAKTPEQVARYRQDGESLQTQLAHVRASRERDLQAVETACMTKIEAERERHELTATIDLVALCHATYDVLTYRAELTSPEGRPLTLEVRYWPVTKELAFPECPACRHTMEEPVALANGQVLCSHCTMECGGCGALHDGATFVAGQCASCAESVCSACQAPCVSCHHVTCETHTAECATCEAPVCPGCVASCAVCEAALCGAHAHVDTIRDRHYCDAHQGAILTADVSAIYVNEKVIQAIVEDAPIAEEPVVEVPVPAAPVWVEPQPETIKLFGEPERVVSSLSGKTLNPRVAETCHACSGSFDVQEMHNCATCGVPACLPCTQGELGPCPACAGLEDVDSTDERLGFVVTSFPELAKRRSWAISQLGPYVVAHWKRWGHWGMVVYHAGGEPVVLTAFSHGPVETLAMTIGSLLPGGRQ